MAEVIERDATIAPIKRDMPAPAQPPRLLDQVRERIRVLHYARATVEMIADDLLTAPGFIEANA